MNSIVFFIIQDLQLECKKKHSWLIQNGVNSNLRKTLTNKFAWCYNDYSSK